MRIGSNRFQKGKIEIQKKKKEEKKKKKKKKKKKMKKVENTYQGRKIRRYQAVRNSR